MVIGGKAIQYLEPGVRKRRAAMGDDASDAAASRAAYEAVAGPVEASIDRARKAAIAAFARGKRVTAEIALPHLQNVRAALVETLTNGTSERVYNELRGQIDVLDKWIAKWTPRLGKNIGITDANTDKAQTLKAITSALQSLDGAAGAAATVASAKVEALQVAANTAKKIAKAPLVIAEAAVDAASRAVGFKIPWWAKWAALGAGGLVVLWVARPYVGAVGKLLPRRGD